MIRINIEFKDGKRFSNLIRYIANNLVYPEAQEQVRILGHHAAENMQETIRNNKKRPSFGSNLEDSITAETLETTGGVEVGIGKISKLKTDAPYFEVLDAGGYVPYSTRKAAPPGSFEGDRPISGGSGQHWERSGGKGFYMKPKKAIEGINYISKAISFIDKELKGIIIKLGGTFINGLGKASK